MTFNSSIFIIQVVLQSVDSLIGKTDLQLDKEAVQRLIDISKLPSENKNYVLELIDIVLMDLKAKMAYAS